MPPQLPQNVPSRAHEIIVTCIVCPVVAAIFVSIRVWTRIVVTRNLGWDDYAAIITLFFCIAFSIVLAISTQYGMGLHLYDVRTILKPLMPSQYRSVPFSTVQQLKHVSYLHHVEQVLT